MLNKTIIVVGLGNPGSKYEKTRHNAGFRVIELFRKKNGYPTFSFSKKLQSEISEMIINEIKVVLVKPLTFMNLSGVAVKKILELSGVKLCSATKQSQILVNLVILHDDIDIPLGSVKLSSNRGSGGHKGVASIIKELGTKDFKRIRIGILPEKKPKIVDAFVLEKFLKDEKIPFAQSLKNAVAEIEKMVLKV